jgi:hypothetical protein
MTYLTKKRKKKILKIKLIISGITALVVLGVVGYGFYQLNNDIERIVLTPSVTVAERKQAKPPVVPVAKLHPVLDELGAMGKAISDASNEFGVPWELMVGIANAESSLGKNFYNEYDKSNCHNWWGLKGGNMAMRKDGSWLRCFSDEQSGARTLAKTLKNYYLAEGRVTAEQIAVKYVGRNQTPHHKQWVANVNKYYKN